MTYEEAKMQIQAIPEKIWDQLSEPDREAMEMAFSALEKQIPKKPEQSKIPRYGMGYEYYDWCCPTCGRFLAFESSKGDHHCTCGQAIEWEEE
jgi:hypothetical protein